MKKVFTTVLFLALGLILSVSVYGKDKKIVTKGHWGGGIIRSLAPPPPEAYIGGHLLMITCESALDDLLVTVCDENGAIVRRETISIEIPGTCKTIMIPYVPGNYRLFLSHYHGQLSGDFEIE
ncbi:DUF3244 domain-containing protein [Parabacteroides sp. OttesenSCG-928-J18]|nr:DUF3244 domain-containing protein [Parabacteroides sp. OttesenSCG-928-J18]